ncbi:MAG: type II toxin-antitoxin system VapC family toxin [Roseimicrobium sp.]
MKQVLVDAGPLAALFARRDQFHLWTRARFSTIRPPLFTCEPVLTEAFHLLKSTSEGVGKLHSAWTQGIVRTEFSAEPHKAALAGLMRQYRDVPMSLADACLVRMSELNTDCEVMTTDRDFLVYRRLNRRVIPLIAPWQT